MQDRTAVLMRAIDPDLAPMRAAASGAVAAFAYLATMYVDIALTGSQSDDLLMIGRPLSSDPRRARLLGLAAHTGFGTTMGLVYGGLARKWLPGPNWARGIVLMLAENTILWPLTLVIDRTNPAMTGGEIPRLNAPLPFAQQIVRHIAFGAVLGVLYGDPRPAVAAIPKATVRV